MAKFEFEHEVDALVEFGYIWPSQKDSFTEYLIAWSDPNDILLPNNEMKQHKPKEEIDPQKGKSCFHNN